MHARGRLVVRRSIAAAVLFASLTALGCGGGTGDVSGTVSYKGKLLDGGSIQFQSGGKTISAEIGKDGKYSVSGVPVGTAKLAISYVDPKATEYFRALSAASKGGGGGAAGGPGAGRGEKEAPAGALAKADPTQFNKVPDKYSDFSQSGLTFEVKKGPNTTNIELN